MSQTLYFGMIGLIIVAVLMFFGPFRQFVLAIFGAKSIWSLLWSFFTSLFTAHWTVLKNFLPRSVVYPTLDDRKTTNAED